MPQRNAEHLEISHARNENPRPPIEVEVEGGTIKKITFNSKVPLYFDSQIRTLLADIGIIVKKIMVEVPDKHEHEPWNNLVLEYIPGTYDVEHKNGRLILPEKSIKVSLCALQ